MTANYHTYAVNCWCEQPPVRMEKVETEDRPDFLPGQSQTTRQKVDA